MDFDDGGSKGKDPDGGGSQPSPGPAADGNPRPQNRKQAEENRKVTASTQSRAKKVLGKTGNQKGKRGFIGQRTVGFKRFINPAQVEVSLEKIGTLVQPGDGCMRVMPCQD